MKKILIIALLVVVVLGIIAGGIFLYVSSTPEYALKQIITDVDAEGLDGLKPHLTSDALAKVEAVEDFTDSFGILDTVSSLTGGRIASYLKSKLSEAEWTVDDVLRGDNRTDVILRFNYDERIIGTIKISMIKDDGEWKIDSLSYPSIDEFSLW